MYLKILILQIVQAAIPYFKKDKVSVYNDFINTYSQTHINNSQAIMGVFTKLIAANKQYIEETPEVSTTSIH